MATAAVSLPQQIPHMPIPHVPRVRPPRILKGTPSPNSVPQPPGPVPSGKVWAQGRWRDAASNSANASRQHQSRQVEKALRHDTHGQNIYAYANIRTHQVVYSLTRVMINNKILPQLIYHGKKTVPAALRRDHWTPYFSLHFPPNEYGSSSGLLAYHQLRELSKQRQLAPPEDMVITTQEDINRIIARWDPIDFEQMVKTKKLILPQVGQLLPKELRAKKLMSQKTTSVADVAFVLGLQAEGPDPEEAARLKEERRKEWWDNISRGAKARAKKRARLREGKEGQLEARRRMAMKADEASLGLKSDAATRIAMEYQGAVIRGWNQVDLTKRKVETEEEGKIEEDSATDGQDHDSGKKAEPGGRVSGLGDAFTKAQEKWQRGQSPVPTAAAEATEATGKTTEGTNLVSLAAAGAEAQIPRDPKEVRVLWADLRDAAYAEVWPETVVHAELERMAVAMGKVIIPKGRKEVLVPKSRSVHVIGGQKGSGGYLDPDEVEKRARGRKQNEPEPELGEEAAAEGVEGSKEVAAGGSESSQEFAQRQDAAEALREKGIEVETPRRGLWSRAKGLVGR